MASFVGTKEEFKRYVGPMLRNLVQQLTRKHKLEVGQCEHCGTTETLEAAHIHGKDRGTIIDKILNNYTNNNVVTIDLGNFEQHFRKEHKIIDETILILCKSCHTKYDSQHIIEAPQTTQSKKSSTQKSKENSPDKNSSDKLKEKRLFSNQEIQLKISKVAQQLSTNDLENLCNPLFSKELFKISFPIFKKVPKETTLELKSAAVKDSNGISRWTWKYEFEKGGYLYAITTQWYPRNDIFVQNWLEKYKSANNTN